ncbi:BA14K family protein [Sulfitobacter sp. 20_GPM-1509m]|uniref:BA14K family protein n=1 Tax=Sulfitobacter sp. 20_GPM-1509m TaxID=1380367 RepID=UPI0004901814|nr:BA14K family protein [Sulfitobacter sp. 20_GPM-1509m]
MTTKKFFSHVVQALTVAAVTIPMAGEAVAQGYGYGNQTGGGGYQAPPPKRHKAGKQAYSGSNPHLAWCYSRYRSYRQSDNTFQPYHGPRKECLSPYESERRALFFGAPGHDGSGSRLTGRDRFGNLPEQGRAGDAPAFAPNGQSDDFGNLPEQPPVANPAPAAAAEVEIAETPTVQPVSADDSTVTERSEVDPADAQADLPTTDNPAGSDTTQPAVALQIVDPSEGSPDAE